MLNISSPRGHWKWNQFHTSVKCQLPRRPAGVMWLFYIYRVSKERVRPSLWGQREGHARNRTCSLCFHVHVFLLKAAMLLCGNSLCVHGRIRVLLCVINLAPGDFFALRMDEVLVTTFSEDEQIAYQWRQIEDLKGIIHPSILFAFLRTDPSVWLSGSADAKH